MSLETWRKKRIAFMVVMLILVILLELMYDQYFFNKSLTFEQRMQEGAPQTKINAWKYFTDSAFDGLDIFIFFLWGFPKQRARLLYYIVAFGFNEWLYSLLKITYHQARPFWVKEGIQAFNCNTSFGNPSGHSSYSMGALLLIYLDYINTIKTGYFSHVLCKVVFGILAVSYSMAIGYSRMFLGVHSLNQVVYGWSLGIWMAFTFQYCFSDLIMNHAQRLLDARANHLQRNALRTMVVWISLFVVEVMNFVCVSYFNIPPEWEVMIEKKCGEISGFEYFRAYWDNSQGLAAVFGAYYGIILQSKRLGGLTQYVLTPKKNPNWKIFARYLILLVIIVPLISLRSISYGKNAGVLAVRFMDDTFPFFLLYFYAFGMCDNICFLCSLYDKGNSEEIRTQRDIEQGKPMSKRRRNSVTSNGSRRLSVTSLGSRRSSVSSLGSSHSSEDNMQNQLIQEVDMDENQLDDHEEDDQGNNLSSGSSSSDSDKVQQDYEDDDNLSSSGINYPSQFAIQ